MYPAAMVEKGKEENLLQVLDLISFLRSRTSLVSHRLEFKIYMEISKASPLSPTPFPSQKRLLLFLSSPILLSYVTRKLVES